MARVKTFAINRRIFVGGAGALAASTIFSPVGGARAVARTRRRRRGQPQAVGRTASSRRPSRRSTMQGRLRGHALAGEPREDAEEQGQQYLSVVQMDDPVMILAVREGPARAADAGQGAEPRRAQARHRSTWTACGRTTCSPGRASPTTRRRMKTRARPRGPTLYDPKYKGRVIIPSLQNTEGLPNLFMAGLLATGKPMAEAQKDIDAGFKKLVALKPNLLTIYTQMPQAFNLLEQGEACMIVERALVLSRSSARTTARRSTSPRRRKASSPCRPASRVVKGGPQSGARLRLRQRAARRRGAGQARAADLLAADQQRRAAAARHADRRQDPQRRLGVRRRQPQRLGQALGPRDGDVSALAIGS